MPIMEYLTNLLTGALTSTPVSPTTPLPVTITEGNLSLGNVTLGNSTSAIGAVTVTSGNVTLNAGANIAGKFGIDQTTAGVTNGVFVIGQGVSTAVEMNADGIAATATALASASFPLVFNGTSWDLQREPGNATIAGIGAAAVGVVGDKYVNISTSTTTTVKSTPGIVKSVIINTLGTGSSTTTIKDGANTVAIINSLTLSGAFPLNATCAANITCITTGTVAPNVTVTFQ